MSGLVELAPGLHRWTARHPDADPNPDPGSPADWGPDVGCIAYEAPDALVLVDPLVHDWAPLDALVERHGRPVVVLTTMRFHGRSRADVAERYGAELRTHTAEPPAGVRRIPVEGMDESMVYLEAPRALVPGDRLIADGSGALVPCPASWLRYIRTPPTPPDAAALREALAPLLELDAELVLVSHGEPVLQGGAEALRAALA
jgi:hypothetical protein